MNNSTDFRSIEEIEDTPIYGDIEDAEYMAIAYLQRVVEDAHTPADAQRVKAADLILAHARALNPKL